MISKVIFMNDAPRLAVIGEDMVQVEERCREALEILSKAHFETCKWQWNSDFKQYRDTVYWPIHDVPLEIV